MVICIKFGLLGSANRLLEYLENQKQVLGILPCERADLIMMCDSFNQGVNLKTVIDMIERIDELIAWGHDIQRDKGMASVLGYSVNFYGKASDLLESMRNPNEKNVRKIITKIGIAPKLYSPSKEQEGVVEKGLWSVHGLSQSESEEHRTMGISVCVYDSDKNNFVILFYIKMALFVLNRV